MDELTSQVLAGVLTAAVADTGRWIARQFRATPKGQQAEDLAIARWFDTYALTESAPDLGTELDTDQLRVMLESHDMHALVHELLAVRLSEAPEIEVERLRAAMRTLFQQAELPGDGASGVFDYFDREICALVVGLGADHPEIRQNAYLARVNATLSAIERHVATLASRDNPMADEDFVRRYRRQLVDYHGTLQPPDFQHRRKVPIADIYVAQSFSRRGGGDSQLAGELDIWELAKVLDRTVILGDPGGGKTTASKVLVHSHADDRSARVPFLVTLREFAAEAPPARSVVAHIEHKLETFHHCPAPSGLVERLLLNGSALVVFDGLDELIDTSRRAEVTEIVERFCTEFPLSAVLVTSRTIGYDQAALDESQFTAYYLADFDANRVAEYVRKWFAQDEDFTDAEAERCATDFLSASAAVSDLRSNPLMLALMCILYRGEGSIPRRRPEVYAQCAALFFDRWDARRGIHVDLSARNLVEPALRHIAYWLFTRAASEFAVPRSQLIAECARYFHERGFEQLADAEAAAEEFVDFCRGRFWVFSDAGTTAHGEELYTFTHRTFLEYFAAVQLARQMDTPEQLARSLAPRIVRQEWDVVAQLALQIKDRTTDRGAERFYRKLLSDRQYRSERSRGNILKFLCRALSVVSPPVKLVRELTTRAMDWAFQEVNNDGARFERLEPLYWLIYSCTDQFDIVSDELSSVIHQRICSDDFDARVLALRIALFAGHVARVGMPSSHAALSVGRWERFGEENRVRYADEIETAAQLVPDLAAAMFLDGRLDMRKLLSWHGPDPSVLFRRIRTVPGPYFHVPLILGLLAGSPPSKFEGEPKWQERQLLDVGDHLENGEFPPRLELPSPSTVRGYPWRAFLPRSASTKNSPLDGRALAVVGVLLCMAAELEFRGDLPHIVSEDPDLRVFMPYLLRRGSETGVELPDLDVPEKYQALLVAWAKGELDFVR